MKFQMHEMVGLKKATDGPMAGAKGIIVMPYEYPQKGYDVEFPELQAAMPMLTLGPDDLDAVPHQPTFSALPPAPWTASVTQYLETRFFPA